MKTFNQLFVKKATYCGRNVKEIWWKNVPILIRTNDEFINASQILKAAKLKKQKRKEILKKLCKLVPFEKVETGFYVYQGIWIPKIAGRRLAETWGLGKVVEPLLKSD
jgi:hypothetical protein